MVHPACQTSHLHSCIVASHSIPSSSLLASAGAAFCMNSITQLRVSVAWTGQSTERTGTMQAQEAGIAEATPAVAAAEEPHRASGGALGHLISMYGASQEASQDAAGSRDSPGDIGEVVAPDAGSNSAVQPVDGHSAEDDPVHKSVGQPRETPPTADPSDREHGKRTGADTGGGAVAEQAAQQAQRAEQPPAEVQGIVAKLLAFVKVRLSPLVPLRRRAVLWSPGAQTDDCWRTLLAAAMLMPV